MMRIIVSIFILTQALIASDKIDNLRLRGRVPASTSFKVQNIELITEEDVKLNVAKEKYETSVTQDERHKVIEISFH